MAYVEIKFSNQAKDQARKLLDSVSSAEDYYYSDVVEHISGSVINNLHLTLFFGLNEQEIENNDLKKLIADANLDHIKATSLELKDGYKGLYQILMLQVSDEGNELKQLHNKISKFRTEAKYTHNTFEPHITLAYVDKDFVLKNNSSVDMTLLACSIDIKLFKD